MTRAARLRRSAVWHRVDRCDHETIVTACGISEPRTCWQSTEVGGFNCDKCKRVEQRRIREMSARRNGTAPSDPRRAVGMAVYGIDDDELLS